MVLLRQFYYISLVETWTSISEEWWALRLLVNSRIRQLSDCQLADWTACRLVKSQS